MTTAWKWSMVAALVVMLLGGGGAFAQDIETGAEPVTVLDSAAARQKTAAEAARLAEASIAAFRAGEFAKAQALLEEQLTLQPENFVVLYNLACARALQGDADGAMARLFDAIEKGFTDRRHMLADPSLRSVRNHPKMLGLLEEWPNVLAARGEANILANQREFQKGYALTRDQELRLAYLSAFDARSFETAREEMTRLSHWADKHVFAGLLDAAAMADDAWVVVVLPNRQDFMRWAVSVYGQGAVSTTSMIAGSYEQDAKRLVAMDLGSTLRHEFFHALHWRSMTRNGQQHPIWIMEGLCSLVEDYDIDAQGELDPAPSWRTNVAKRLEKIGRIMPLEQLAGMTQTQFTGRRPLANYAVARAFFLFLWERKRLKEWYEAYVAGYEQDATGIKATEQVFGQPIKQVNADFRAWLRALTAVPEQITRGMASLGVDIDAGTGEGPVVVTVERRRNAPDLRPRDVITGIDGRAVRDIAELVRILGTMQAGQEVNVSYRRGKLAGEAKVVLVEKK